MGLNTKIRGELDMHGPATVNLVYEKAIKQEQNLKSISTFHERSWKNLNWSQGNQTSKKPSDWHDFQKKGDKGFCNNQNESRGDHRVNINNNNPSKNEGSFGKPTFRKGKLRGCFTCERYHYESLCPDKPLGTQPHGIPLPPQ